MLDDALRYAARGWRVLPLHWPLKLGGCSCGYPDCRSVGKHPLVWRGVHDATTDEPTIRAWWRRWPRANIGIATGAVSGIDVLDVDPRNGGDDTLAALLAEHGPLPDTVESLTGGGGRHLLFQHSDRVPTKLGPGLDTKADGGYIVAPPSEHASGRRYEWELSSQPDSTDIALWPAWLLLSSPPRASQVPARSAPASRPIPAGTWGHVLAGCMRLRELAALQAERGLSYQEWLHVASVARLGGPDGEAWLLDLTEAYALGCSQEDLRKATAWLASDLRGTATCEQLGCHPGRCGFRPRQQGGTILPPSPLRWAWARAILDEVV